jgi:integrase
VTWAGIGEQLPKSGQVRTVDLTPPAAAALEQWFADCGAKGLDFDARTAATLKSGYVLRSVLYPALERAGIPRVGESGRKRDFHSFRHTIARIALEAGAEITWVEERLGHSSITLTVDLYGHWSPASKKAQAERLAEAFHALEVRGLHAWARCALSSAAEARCSYDGSDIPAAPQPTLERPTELPASAHD